MDFLQNMITNQVSGQIASKTGLDPQMTQKVVNMGLPAIMGALNKNSDDPQGAQGLSSALDNHDGSILDNLSSALGDNAQSTQTDGAKILGHILGNKQENINSQISNDSGIDTGKVMQILSLLAPIVMGYLGKQKTESNLDASGISSLLTNQTKAAGFLDNPLVKGFIDKDGDGNVMNDLMGMLKK